MKGKAKYPEHDKLRPVADKTQFALEFILEFCAQNGVYLEHKDGHQVKAEDLMYKFIGVDRWKLEDEKRAMLASLDTQK